MIFSKTYTDYFLEFFSYFEESQNIGAEGYVKASTGQLNVFYNYVYTYTDHLGNIRLKYTTHPQTGETTILEEDHYYPYGLSHAPYAHHHLTIGLEEPGADITLIEVTPDVSDPHKYKFNGKEYQDEFSIDLYDFGARNYDPAIVRTLTPDPLGEAFYHLSPYSFLNNNPMSNIDPTGALTLTGQAAKDWFQGLKDDIASKPRKRKENEDEDADDVDDESDNSVPSKLATKYIDERGNELINTKDGSDDIITISNERLAEFLKNIYWTPENMLNSQGWNDYWKTEILDFDNSTSMENLLSSAASQESRQRMINYLQSRSISDGLKFVLTEVIYQNLNPLNHLPAPIKTRPVNPWIKFNRQMGSGKFTKHNYGSSKAANKARKEAYSKWKKENKGYY